MMGKLTVDDRECAGGKNSDRSLGDCDKSSREKPTTLNGIFSLADQVVVSGTRFLTTVLILRACGETSLGIYALTLSLVFITIIIQQTLVTTPYANFRHRLDTDQEATYAIETWILSALLALIAVPVIGALGGVFAGINLAFPESSYAERLGELAQGCFYAAVATPFIAQVEFFRRVLLIRMRSAYSLALDASVSLVVVCTLLALIYFQSITVNNVFLTLAIINSVAALIAWMLLVGKLNFRTAGIRETIQKHWQFGRWIFSSEAIAFGRGNMLKWIVGGMLGLGATGIYAACESLMRAINPYFLGVASVAEPTLARGFSKSGTAEVRRLAYKVMAIMAAGTLPICLLVGLGSPLILEYVFDSKLTPYWSVVAWLAASSFITSIGYPLSNSLQAIDRPDINFRIRLFTMVLVIAGSLVLISSAGLWGVAMMQFIGASTSFLLRVYFFRSLVGSRALAATKLAGRV